MDLTRRGKGSSGEETETDGVVGEEEPGDVYELLVPESTVVAVPGAAVAVVVAVEVAAVGIGGGGGVLAVAGEVVDPVNIARMDTMICTSGEYVCSQACFRIEINQSMRGAKRAWSQ